MLTHALIFVLGLVILTVGADQFLRGASDLARRFGVREFVIGMILIGFGTSAPELTVNLAAAFHGRYDLAIGNVVGSNIANVGLILGISALIAPLAVQMRLVKVETPILIAASVGLWLLCADGGLSRLDGLILLAGFAGVIALVAADMRLEPANIQDALAESVPASEFSPRKTALRTIGGLIGLILGAELMVDGAVAMARILGMSELMIGLTVVAIGTSLPELASSGMAAWRGQVEIALGNVLGSCLFNIFLILGITSTVHPLPVAKAVVSMELPMMIGFALVLVPIMLRNKRISRRSGAMLLLAYAAFLVWQVQVGIQPGFA
ncbi:MAG: calcium/sodium antiporter [Xanthomonadales bacterium]|nr:calcium/sodium antiporter [Xanthomonadales bacterium]